MCNREAIDHTDDPKIGLQGKERLGDLDGVRFCVRIIRVEEIEECLHYALLCSCGMIFSLW